MKQLYVILPSPNATGPIKGAFAVINKLIQEFEITVIFKSPVMESILL